jgi:hypothetical protein
MANELKNNSYRDSLSESEFRLIMNDPEKREEYLAEAKDKYIFENFGKVLNNNLGKMAIYHNNNQKNIGFLRGRGSGIFRAKKYYLEDLATKENVSIPLDSIRFINIGGGNLKQLGIIYELLVTARYNGQSPSTEICKR